MRSLQQTLAIPNSNQLEAPLTISFLLSFLVMAYNYLQEHALCPNSTSFSSRGLRLFLVQLQVLFLLIRILEFFVNKAGLSFYHFSFHYADVFLFKLEFQ